MSAGSTYERGVKRVFDVLVALAALPFAALIAIPVALAIKLDDGGPVLFAAPRLGRGMTQFRLFKFRSMSVGAPDLRNADGSTFNSAQDSRVTKVGAFIRRTSIDELPQLINILRGEMSIVGPRPSPLGNESRYTDDYRRRFEVRPGLTGHAQANLRNTGTLDERAKFDIEYVEKVSFVLDVRTVIRTIVVVLTGFGLHRNPS